MSREEQKVNVQLSMEFVHCCSGTPAEYDKAPFLAKHRYRPKEEVAISDKYIKARMPTGYRARRYDAASAGKMAVVCGGHEHLILYCNATCLKFRRYTGCCPFLCRFFTMSYTTLYETRHLFWVSC